MQNYASWDVEHDEPTQAKADLLHVAPMPLPTVDYGEPISNEQKAVRSPHEAVDVPAQMDGRDGKYFENKLTHTIFYRSIGRLLGRHGSTFRLGTAFAVGPRLIVTAGHCVHLDGTPLTDLLFQPGFPALGRTIPIDRVFVPDRWVSHTDYTLDIALLVTREVISSEMWFGVKTHLPDPGYQGWGLYGYPGDPPFDGTVPIGDSGPSTNKPWATGQLRFSVNACDWIDLTPGASGGPWIHDKRNQGTVVIEGKLPDAGQKPIYVNGLNSHFIKGYPGIMISPQFGPLIRDFLIQALKAVGT